MFNLILTKKLRNLLFQKSLLVVLMNRSCINEDVITGYKTNRKSRYSWVNRTSAIIDLKKKGLKRIEKKLMIAQGQDDRDPNMKIFLFLLWPGC